MKYSGIFKYVLPKNLLQVEPKSQLKMVYDFSSICIREGTLYYREKKVQFSKQQL